MRTEIYDLTRVLAWAARHRIPFDDAIDGFRKSYRDFAWLELLSGGMFFWFSPFGMPAIRRRHVFHYNLRGLVKDIRAGRSLSQALSRRLGRFLPDYYVPVIETAESADGLAMVLDNLEATLKRDLNSELLSSAARTYVWMYGLIAGSLISGLMIFIVPKFAYMFDEMLAGEPLPMLTRIVIHLMAAILYHTYILVLIVLVLALHRLLRRATFYRWLWELPVLAVPLAGRMARLERLQELGRGMSSYLRLGYDVPDAAEAVRASVWSPWLGWKLRRFSRQTRAGMPWPQAWEKSGLGNRLERWVVLNGQFREDPASGFADLAELAQARLEHTTAMINRVVPILLVVVAGFVIGSVVLALFMPLIKLIDMMTLF